MTLLSNRTQQAYITLEYVNMHITVEKAFDDAVAQSVKAGYNPTQFNRMRKELGTLETVKKLLISSNIQTGLKRCDQEDIISVEKLVLQHSKFFGPELTACAKFKLKLLKLKK
jgi:hypothetical protein